MTRIHKRVVLHFPGFEPLDATAHRARYDRSAKQSAKAWNYQIETGSLQDFGTAPFFDLRASGEEWQSTSRIHVLDHNELVTHYNAGGFAGRFAAGYVSALRIALAGGLFGYFRHAWRFGLFFVFPFLLMLLGLAVSAAIALVPHAAALARWNYIWSLALAFGFFVYVFLPQAARLHTLHLFGDWRLAVAMASLKPPGTQEWIERCAAGARRAFDEAADEYVISSHSMGSTIAIHVIGLLLEREPQLFQGKRIVFATLGSAILQCALIRPATILRSRVGLVARCKEIFWLDVHCLTDAIHFYKARTVAVCGHPDAPQANIALVRFKGMLSQEHYRKIKRDFLRVHRQYVLGPDRKAPFDFTLLTAGPLPAADFAAFTQAKMPSL